MNIFILDRDLKVCSQSLVDKHVRKMLIEAVQMVSIATAYHIGYISDTVDPHGTRRYSVFKQTDGLYKYTKSQASHPCSIWTRACIDNAVFLAEYAVEMAAEYEHRFGTTPVKQLTVLHSCLLLLLAPGNLPCVGSPTKFIQCMHPAFRSKSAVTAYRQCYVSTKKHLIQYTNRKPPSFLKDPKYVVVPSDTE